MKTTIETKTAGTITIESVFLGNKQANWGAKQDNWNNSKVTIRHNGKKFSFDFWGSIVNPEITTNDQNIFALYCVLTDGLSAIDSFDEFCSQLGYDTDSRKAEKIYNLCLKSLAKIQRVFTCDLYDLINEIQDTYNC